MFIRLFVIFLTVPGSLLATAASKANAQEAARLRVNELLAAGTPVTIACQVAGKVG